MALESQFLARRAEVARGKSEGAAGRGSALLGGIQSLKSRRTLPLLDRRCSPAWPRRAAYRSLAWSVSSAARRLPACRAPLLSATRLAPLRRRAEPHPREVLLLAGRPHERVAVSHAYDLEIWTAYGPQPTGLTPASRPSPILRPSLHSSHTPASVVLTFDTTLTHAAVDSRHNSAKGSRPRAEGSKATRRPAC